MTEMFMYEKEHSTSVREASLVRLSTPYATMSVDVACLPVQEEAGIRMARGACMCTREKQFYRSRDISCMNPSSMVALRFVLLQKNTNACTGSYSF
jgi:hypothetical protein